MKGYDFNLTTYSQEQLEKVVLKVLDNQRFLARLRRKKKVTTALNTGIMISLTASSLAQAETSAYNAITEMQTVSKSVSDVAVPIQRLALKEVTHYAPGQYRLTNVHLERLDKIIEKLPTGSKVTVIGNTDSIGSQRSNMELGKERARLVAMYLAYKDVDIKAVKSKGEHNPIDRRSHHNRRVDLLI
jgi:outer membrane protein OmpA-like peptidoglycan-associated protein